MTFVDYQPVTSKFLLIGAWIQHLYNDFKKLQVAGERFKYLYGILYSAPIGHKN